MSQQVVRILEEQGAEASADGRLDQVAAWAARRYQSGQPPDGTTIDGVSRRAGHVGAPPFVAFLRVRNFDKLKDSALRNELLELFEKIPSNMVVSRWSAVRD